jgi:glutamine amidotransferase
MGNMFSVKRVCENVGMHVSITNKADAILKADALVLPGVGSFGVAMNNLRKLDLISPIFDFIATGKPFIGICLGMQLLMTESSEFGTHKGLNVISGSVARFPSQDWYGIKYKVPQVGWNRISKPLFSNLPDPWKKTPLHNIKDGEHMYFVHSYFVKPESKDSILTLTTYSIPYASSIVKENVWGFQFHPEKSGNYGIKLFENLKNLLEMGGTHD